MSNFTKKETMKKLHILFAFVMAVLLSACNDVTLPSADYNRAQVQNLIAVPGDEQVVLSWEPYEGFHPDAYRLSWGDKEDETVMLNTPQYVVTGLENDQKYTFTIQAVYGTSVNSGKVSITCTPVTSRIAVGDVTVTPADGALTLAWQKPIATVKGYTLTVTLGDQTVKTVELGADDVSTTIDGLINYKNYTVTFVAHYANGDSKPTTVKGMPATGPLYTISTDNAGLGAEVTYQLDENVEATQVVWQFDDGASATDRTARHRYTTAGAHITHLKVTLADGSNIDVDIEMNVRDSYFDTSDFEVKTGDYNGFKGQCPVFSPDGKTVYAVTFRAPAGLYAYDILTGKRKWGYVGKATSAAYGCAPVVDPNSGVAYYGTAVAGDFFAVNPDGTLKWKCTKMKSVNKAYPAIGSDGTVYVLDSGSKVWALSAADGSVKWSVQLSGAPGAVLVNETGRSLTGDGEAEVIVGTKTTLYFITKGGQVKTGENLDSHGMTEITGFAASPDHRTIYYGTKGNGLYSVNLSTHEQKFFHEASMASDVYCPVVAPDGTIVFGMKTTSADPTEAVFGVNPDMTKKWSYTVTMKNAFNYCHPAIDAQGNTYIGMNDGTLLMINPSGKVANSWGVASANGFMSAVNICDYAVFGGTIGSKTTGGRLYGAYIGGGRAKTWSSRGGDICGASCLK